MEEFCRTYLTREGAKFSIFHNNFNSTDDRDVLSTNLMIKEVAAIQILENDEYSTLICEKCIKCLRDAFIFRQQCQKADILLHSPDTVTDCSIKCVKIENESNENDLNENNELFWRESDIPLTKTENEIALDTDYKNELNTDIPATECSIECVKTENESNENDLNENNELFWGELDVPLMKTENEIAHDMHHTNPLHIVIKNEPCELSSKNESLNDLMKNKSVENKKQDKLNKSKKLKKSIVLSEKDIKKESTENQETKVNDDSHHMYYINESGMKEYYCFTCKSIYTEKKVWLDHLKTHNNKMPYICRKCGKNFKKMSSLKFHHNQHMNGRQFCCEVCGRKYYRSFDLKVHMRNHTGEKPYSCPVCQKKFRRQNGLKHHSQSHSDIKLYTCKICGKNVASLVAHMRVHSDKRNYKCNVCNKSFFRKTELQMHMVVHTGSKNYECEVCGKAFGWKRSLKKHLSIHDALFL